MVIRGDPGEGLGKRVADPRGNPQFLPVVLTDEPRLQGLAAIRGQVAVANGGAEQGEHVLHAIAVRVDHLTAGAAVDAKDLDRLDVQPGLLEALAHCGVRR